MEHIIVKDLGNGFYNLTPEDGYILYNKVTRTYHSEAVTKKKSDWIAVEKTNETGE
jgi:hypothetical protein